MTIGQFKKIVWDYYRQNKRAMPWREKVTPYRVFVSEVMLQQTQVARVTEKFPQFVKAFPHFKALAEAPLRAVLVAWQGMGYNRRALYLKKAAETVMRDYRGRLPNNPQLLEKLAGIGPATARSITAFAWNSPEIFIETNIRSVFLYHFFPNQKKVLDVKLLPFVARTLDKKNPREWYYALMDYGVMLKRENKNPSRASAHHAKQSKFRGSLRETRGKIITILSSGIGSCTNALLIRRAAEPAVKVRTALRGLMRDGLIIKEGTQFKIV